MRGSILLSTALLLAASGPSFAQRPAVVAEDADPGQAMVMPDEQAIPAEALMGKPLVDADGSQLGLIEDVVLGSDGQAEQIVVSKSGVPGGQPVAIDVNAIVWQPGLDLVRLTSLTRSDVQAMPEADYDEGMSALDRE